MEISQLYRLFRNSSGVCTDSRKIVEGSIFFALKGANFNGNEHALAALKGGCSYALIDEKQGDYKNLILVDNVLEHLQQLANFHRNAVDPLVLGITGSNGKTTTKELLHVVIGSEKKTHATKGNFNNHIGVPLTLLAMPEETEVAIIEMGANHVGEIEALCAICDPNLGVITNIGKAHLEGFGSVEGVIQAKGELYDHIRAKNGKLLVDSDDELLMGLSEGLIRSTYGTLDTDVVGKCTHEVPFLSVSWNSENGSGIAKSQLSGAHNFQNILCAIAAGVELCISPENIDKSIANYVSDNNRSQWVETVKNKVFLDAYNANPSSMELAIKAFAKQEHTDPLMILGDMKELGDFSVEEHQKIIHLGSELGIPAIFIGPEFGQVIESETHYSYASDLMKALKTSPLNGKTILIKGSRGIALEKVLEVL